MLSLCTPAVADVLPLATAPHTTSKRPCRPLIQPQLVVSRRGRISEVNSAPFDIEDPVGRRARYRREHTAVATRESRAPAVCIGALSSQ